MQRSYFILIPIFFLFYLSGCQEKPKWKRPTTVALDFKLEAPGNGGPGTLTFTEGEIHISEITILGKLESGENYEFSRDFPQGLVVDFSNPALLDDLKFDIPQGNYTELKIHFQTMVNNQTILAKGIFDYNNPNKSDAIVTFEVDSIRVFDLLVTSAQGNSFLSILEGNSNNISILLNPPYWFKNVTSTMVNNSSSTIMNNQTHILINRLTNTNIYQAAEARIGDDEKSTLN